MKYRVIKTCYILLFLLLGASSPVMAAPSLGTYKLTHQDAMDIAIEKNPMVDRYKEQVEAIKGNLIQAGLIPNPELSIEVENFGGAGELHGFKGSETTFTVEQMIELGGKRRARQGVAQKDLEIAMMALEIAKLDVATLAEKAFWRSYILEKKVRLTRELLRLAQATFDTVRARVEAGKVSKIEEIKAKVFLSSSEILYRESVHQKIAAKNALATALGLDDTNFDDILLEDNSTITPPPSLEELLSRVKRGVRVRQLKSKAELAERRLKLAKSNAIPDLRLGLGVRHFEDTDDEALVASISIPIPIFNRNQGEKLRTLREISQNRYEQMAKELELTQQLFASYHRLENAYEKMDRLSQETIPNAKKGFEATKQGYSHGKFRYLDVLDAQRTLYELELQYLDALLSYWLNLADIKSIIGVMELR